MHHKIGNIWIEDQQLIDLYKRHSNVEIRLCWCQNESMWTYDITNHLILEQKPSLHWLQCFILQKHFYELHPMDKQVFNDIINDEQICLAYSILAIFSICSFQRIHVIGIYFKYQFLTCVCIRGEFLATYCTYIDFKRGIILCIRGIDFWVMHACGSQF